MTICFEKRPRWFSCASDLGIIGIDHFWGSFPPWVSLRALIIRNRPINASPLPRLYLYWVGQDIRLDLSITWTNLNEIIGQPNSSGFVQHFALNQTFLLLPRDCLLESAFNKHFWGHQPLSVVTRPMGWYINILFSSYAWEKQLKCPFNFKKAPGIRAHSVLQG